jgi:hypothetical protein
MPVPLNWDHVMAGLLKIAVFAGFGAFSARYAWMLMLTRTHLCGPEPNALRKSLPQNGSGISLVRHIVSDGVNQAHSASYSLHMCQNGAQCGL